MTDPRSGLRRRPQFAEMEARARKGTPNVTGLTYDPIRVLFDPLHVKMAQEMREGAQAHTQRLIVEQEAAEEAAFKAAGKGSRGGKSLRIPQPFVSPGRIAKNQLSPRRCSSWRTQEGVASSQPQRARSHQSDPPRTAAESPILFNCQNVFCRLNFHAKIASRVTGSGSVTWYVNARQLLLLSTAVL